MVARTASAVRPPCSGCQWKARLLTATKSSRSASVNARVVRPDGALGGGSGVARDRGRARNRSDGRGIGVLVDLADPELHRPVGVRVEGRLERLVEIESVAVLADDAGPAELPRGSVLRRSDHLSLHLVSVASVAGWPSPALPRVALAAPTSVSRSSTPTRSASSITAIRSSCWLPRFCRPRPPTSG